MGVVLVVAGVLLRQLLVPVVVQPDTEFSIVVELVLTGIGVESQVWQPDL